MSLLVHGATPVGPGRYEPGGPVDLRVADGVITSIEPATPTAHAAGAERAETAEYAGRAEAGRAGTVLDAHGLLVLPGLIDSHRHTWQTALRQRGADWSLGDYLRQVFGPIGARMRPADVYAGTLLGAYTALDAGITTLVDWAHIQNTPEHADAGIDALHDAGIRAVYGHGWSAAAGIRPDQPHPTDLRRLRAGRLADDSALVTLAMGLRGPDFTTLETTAADVALARELAVPITMHVASGPPAAEQRGIERLAGADLLGSDLTVVHATGASDHALRLLADHGVGATVSPQIEQTMPGFGGRPALDRMLAAGVRVGLSTDSETAVAGDLFTQLKFALASWRASQDPAAGAERVLRMATIDGAAVAGLAGRAGELSVGAAADLTLMRANAVNLTPLHDPTAAVVLAAHPGNVDTVLVGGRVVKRSGRLVADLDRARRLAAASVEHLGDARAAAD